LSCLHNLQPTLVDVAEALRFSWELTCNISRSKHGLEVDPVLLNLKPEDEGFIKGGKKPNPLCDLLNKWLVEPVRLQ
jgi:hypothetical protein